YLVRRRTRRESSLPLARTISRRQELRLGRSDAEGVAEPPAHERGARRAELSHAKHITGANSDKHRSCGGVGCLCPGVGAWTPRRVANVLWSTGRSGRRPSPKELPAVGV